MEKNIILLIRKILIALLVIWMIVVFILSNQSGKESSGLSHKIAMLFTFGNEENADIFEPIVRKVAHVTEYAIGAMLFYGILVTYQRFNFNIKVVMTIVFILAFAGLDEFHQSFINARNGTLLDVGIDFVGGLLGLGACYLVEGMIRVMDNKVQEEIQNSK